MERSRILHVPADPARPVAEWGEDFRRGLARAAMSLGGGEPRQDRRALRLPLGTPAHPPALPLAWLGALRSLAGGPLVETLSITTMGLHTPEDLRRRAEVLELKGFAVADDPQGPAGVPLSLPAGASPGTVTLAGAVGASPGLVVAEAVRPFAHTGFAGAVFQLGCGLMQRSTKLDLHRGVRPSVDTPLCAGCGSCLAACIFDAITIKGGRAAIDHQRCTGCGECMTACHLAGISPRQEGALAVYQKGIATAAVAAAEHFARPEGGELVFVSFITPIGRSDQGGFSRARYQPADMGALLGTDPVALDQATWDLLVAGAPQGLRQWSGFPTDPEVLLDEAAARGLGRRAYRLEKAV